MSFKALHGYVNIRLDNLKQLKKLEFIEGVPTIRRAGSKALWIESVGRKALHRVVFVSGFVVGTSHGSTLAECLDLEEKKLAVSLREIANDNKFLGLRHAKLLGACDAGIKSFAERNGLDLELGYRLGYLKSLGDYFATAYLERA